MVDIAAVSVVSSAVVALGTIGATIFSGERQRAHEAALDFESRVWDRKSEALFTVIEECRKVADSDEPVTDDNRLTYAKNLSKVLDKLHASRATVEAFASSRCREELTGLIEALRASGVKEYVGRQIDVYWEQIMEADPSDDYRAWNRLTEWRKASEERAVADFDVDLPDLRARASRLLEGARESVRRPKD